jgi:uncharacterized protein (TIGR02757 family)
MFHLPPPRLAALKPALDRLYRDYDRAAAIADPVEFVRPFADPSDREIVGFFAAGLAYGRVASVNASVSRVLQVLGPRPAEYVREFDRARQARALDGFAHRWTRGPDLVDVMLTLQRLMREHGSIEGSFVHGWDASAEDVGRAIEAFSHRALGLEPAPTSGASTSRSSSQPLTSSQRRGAAYFFPCPSKGSACKRMNLYLRWMVRQDAVDPGGWTRIKPSQLIIPLDTHVIRVGTCLGLTERTSPGWKMASEITASLRAIDPDDPVKYDFALCHLGMQGLCGLNREQADERCPLRGLCHPGPRRRPASPAPSARR